MAIGYFLRVGDKTTCGGQILTGDNTMQWYGVAGAREGDMVSCGKHSGRFYIIGGCQSVWDEGGKSREHLKVSVHAPAELVLLIRFKTVIVMNIAIKVARFPRYHHQFPLPLLPKKSVLVA